MWVFEIINKIFDYVYLLFFVMVFKCKVVVMVLVIVIEEFVDFSDELMFFCFGGGNEVGCLCYII